MRCSEDWRCGGAWGGMRFAQEGYGGAWGGLSWDLRRAGGCSVCLRGNVVRARCWGDVVASTIF